MHDIEPYYGWRDNYIACEDKDSPFYGREYSEFTFSKKIYNYFIHPQWDEFGSSTLYAKAIFVDYIEAFAIIELIGEWNDCLHNDIMYLKRNVIDAMIDLGIYKSVLICENVLNFHASDESYYEEWRDEVIEDNGWICFMNTLDHVEHEMKSSNLHFFAKIGEHYNDEAWRSRKPKALVQHIEDLIASEQNKIYY